MIKSARTSILDVSSMKCDLFSLSGSIHKNKETVFVRSVFLFSSSFFANLIVLVFFYQFYNGSRETSPILFTASIVTHREVALLYTNEALRSEISAT